MERARPILENHEVNRVRIDLKENPANALWCWGQGRMPKMPSLRQRCGLEGGFYGEALFMKGLGKALALTEYRDLAEIHNKELNIVYFGTGNDAEADQWKAKIRRIEEFDAKIAGAVSKAAKLSKEAIRVAVISNVVHSLPQKMNTHGHTPFLLFGEGIEAGHGGAFNEKNCAQSALRAESGQAFMNLWRQKKENAA